MLDVVSQWVAHYGYVLVAVFLLIEGAGLPIPGETALVTAAALAGRGTLSIVGVVIAGCIGTIAGGHAGYLIGFRGGRRFAERHGKWILLTPERLEKTHTFFEQHGAKTVLLGRFIAFLRSFVGIFAGISRMPLRIFALFNALGGTIWVITFCALGYLFGRNLPRLIHYIGRVSLLIAILIAVIALVVFLWRWFGRNRETVVASLDYTFEHNAATPRMSQMRVEHPGAWRFMSGRYAQREYLALHLIVGFALSLGVIGIFAAITEGLLDTSPLTRVDVVVAARLRDTLAPEALRVFEFFSKLGSRAVMTFFLFGGALLYAVRRKGLELVGWSAAFVGGSALDAALRFAVRRSELPFADVVLIDWSTGLASGHVLGVVVGYGMLAYLARTYLTRAASRMLVIILVVTLVAAITIARLYLGEQFISDATAGLAAGLIWLTACMSGIEIARQRHWER